MKDLTSRDLIELLTAIERLNGPGEVAERVLSAVSFIIPNDLIAFDSFAEDQTSYLPPHWDSNPEMLTPEIEQICAAVFEQNPDDNPLIEELVFNGNTGVMKLTDFGDQAAFRESAYYNEVMRPAGFDRQMAVMLGVAPEVSFSCAVNRRGSDFSERERQLLAMLAPHLQNAIATERERRRHEEDRRWLERAVERAGMSAVSFSADGRVIRETERARSYVNKYFPGADLRRLFPPDHGTAERLSGVSLPETTLRLDAATDPASGETTLIFSETSRLTPKTLEPLGLTPRQAEVLYWIAEGKSDDVIAELTGASRRTVHKHVENIFDRLGAETRTAAVRIAFSRLDHRF